MPSRKTKSILLALFVCLAIFLTVLFVNRPTRLFAKSGSSVRVILIGIDAGSWDTLKRMIGAGKLPHFKKLIDEGSAGHLESFLWRELIQGGSTYASPILWASIATGKMPTKHGIEDFTMPIPSAMMAQIMAKSNPQGYAGIELPDMAHGEMELLFRARSTPPLEKRKIGVYVNSTLLKEITLTKDWQIFDIDISASAYQAQNHVNFYYDAAKQEMGTPIADFNFIRLYDDEGEQVLDLQFSRNRGLFGAGAWQIPEPGDAALSASYHVKAKTLWEILSEYRRTVAVIGWWQSWPAFPINGYLISSHVGFQGARAEKDDPNWLSEIPHLTYPEDYLQTVKSQVFLPKTLDDEINKRFYDIGNCSCVGSTQDKIFRNFFWQDRLFETLSVDLLKNKGPFDLFAVYFRGVDASGHQFLRFEKDADASKDCECDGTRLPLVVDHYYEYMDEVLARLIPFADSNTVVMIVTDHGQVATETKGIHKNNGFVILWGNPIRTHLMEHARVLDVAPTILYLLKLPVAQDMDGTAMLEAIRPAFLKQNPVLLTGTYEDLKTAKQQKKELIDQKSNQEGMDELKALGYINQ